MSVESVGTDGVDPMPQPDLALVDLLDRLIAGGVVVTGDVMLSLAGVDLVYLGLRLVLAPAEEVGEVTVLELFGVSRSRDGAGVEVLYRERSTAPARNTDEMLEYGRELQRIAGRRPVLPFRYGTTVPDQDELAELVRAHQSKWLSRLAVVADHVELIVHGARRRDDVGAEAPRSGRDYLLAKVADHDLQQRLLEVVRPYAREVRVLSGDRMACLVREVDAERVVSLVQLSEPSARCTGPWPPFSFVEFP